MKYVLDASPREAARERMTSVIWTTALGLPIVQPYRKAKKKQILTALQSVFIADPNLPTQVDPVKQSAAFPPNFVHSLDATHMMLTALECRVSVCASRPIRVLLIVNRRLRPLVMRLSTIRTGHMRVISTR